MRSTAFHDPCYQPLLNSAPYDRWVTQGGACMAEFHRKEGGYLVRFPGEADFVISAACDSVDVFPSCDGRNGVAERLMETAIAPVLGNHLGGLFLHGSAVKVDGGAIAFLGQSRSGKTTLAGAFAKSGFPFMTEDVVDLERAEGSYWLRPKQSALRVFPDSAHYILGHHRETDADSAKIEVQPTQDIAFTGKPAPLRQLYLLGDEDVPEVKLDRLSSQQALLFLMPHAFLLDVEDKVRLRGHFDRLAALVQTVDCFAINYRRAYSALPAVRDAIIKNFRKDWKSHEAH